MMRLVWGLVLGCLTTIAAPQTAAQTAAQNQVQTPAQSAPLAELRWLDRTTGEQGDVTLAIGQQANLGALALTVEDCRYPAGSIASDAFAYLDIQQSDPERQWFSGWMVASSPALNALQHPRYDVWLLRCKMS